MVLLWGEYDLRVSYAIKRVRCFELCEEGDLNPHALRHWNLNPARLPFRHLRVKRGRGYA